jgi:hypothetical protein
MGTFIVYRTTAPVDLWVESSIRNDLPEARRYQPWVLCDPIYLAPQRPDRVLIGRSLFNIHPTERDVHTLQEFQARPDDISALIAILGGWSKRWEVSWEILLDDESIGVISHGDDSDVLARLKPIRETVLSDCQKRTPIRVSMAAI